MRSYYSDDVAAHAERVRAWIRDSRRRVANDPSVLTAETREEFEKALEELQVAEEELRAQTEELADTAARLDNARRRYEELFDFAPDAYLVTDRMGTIVEANRAASRLLGAPIGLIEGKPLVVFIDEEDRRAFRMQLDRIARLEQVAEWEVAVGRGQDERTNVAVSAAAMAHPGRDSVEVRWLLRDITDRKRAEAHARQLQWEHAARMASEAAERRANFLAEATRSLSMVVGVSATVERITELAVGMAADYAVVDVVEPGLGMRRSAAAHADPDRADVARRLLRFTPDLEDADAVARVLRTGEAEVITDPIEAACSPGLRRVLLELGPRLELVLPLRARDRMLGTLTLGITETKPWEGNPLTFATAFADRAGLALDNALLLNELVAARDMAQRANEAKAQFLATLSHEFRTPLTAVIGYGELLLAGVPEPLPESLRQYVERIRASSGHQLALVEQILEYARIEGGTEQPHLIPLDLRAPLREAADMVRKDARDGGLELLVSLPEEPVQAYTDPDKLRQIVTNLLANAVHFTQAGEVCLELTRAEDDLAILRVKDTGVGIPADQLARVFDRFWQARPPGGRRGGVGLGLNISRNLVRLLGGEINVESEPGKGSTFTVRLPLTGPPGRRAPY